MNQYFEKTIAFYKLPQAGIGHVAKQYGENGLKKAPDASFLFFVGDPYVTKFMHLLMIQ